MHRILPLMLQSQIPKHTIYTTTILLQYYCKLSNSPAEHLFWDNSTWSEAPEKQEHTTRNFIVQQKNGTHPGGGTNWADVGMEEWVWGCFPFPKMNPHKGKHFSSYMWVLHINHFVWDRGKKVEKIKPTKNSSFQCLSSELHDPTWPNHTCLHCFSVCALNMNTEELTAIFSVTKPCLLPWD